MMTLWQGNIFLDGSVLYLSNILDRGHDICKIILKWNRLMRRTIDLYLYEVFPQFTSSQSVFHSFYGLMNSINWPASMARRLFQN